RDAGGEAETLGVSEADQERPDEAGSDGDGNGGKRIEGRGGAVESFADYGNDGAQVFAGGELGDHAAVTAMDGHLAGDDGGEDGLAVFYYGGGGLVAGGFDGQDSLQAYVTH